MPRREQPALERFGTAGFDAIREDTLSYVPWDFWHNWMAALMREYPRVNVVCEVFDADPALAAFFLGGQARFDGVDSGVESVCVIAEDMESKEAFQTEATGCTLKPVGVPGWSSRGRGHASRKEVPYALPPSGTDH